VRDDDLAVEKAGAWTVDTACLVEDGCHVGEFLEILAVDIFFGLYDFVHLLN
jgi:hypothetical protein